MGTVADLDREAIVTQLELVVRTGRPIIGAGVGNGFAARHAQEGGADIIFLFNSGRFRMAGVTSLAGYLPYTNANQQVMDFGVREVLPRVKGIPVVFGACASDPSLSHAELLKRLQDAGFHGVINFPTMCIMDGAFREMAEEEGLGFQREVEMIDLARRRGLFTVAFAQTPEEARAMVKAGADVLCVHFGFTHSGEGGLRTCIPMDKAIALYQKVVESTQGIRTGLVYMAYGGPLADSHSIREFTQSVKVHGYGGGSSIDSIFVRRTISGTTQLLKNIVHDEVNGPGDLVGSSPPMKQVYEVIRKVAPSDVTVLVTGESGTGKELAVEAIHSLSHRRNKPLLKINCANLPEQLLESELFGHEAGAFTGAVRSRVGRFEQANGGTLVLDEIGELPLAMQPKLLRAIWRQEFERIGGNRTIKVDVRIIACTNRDLAAMVREGKFREDLFWRLNVVNINMPPLRVRPSDIPLLVPRLVERLCARLGRAVPHVDPALVAELSRHQWPGNVREIENFLQRLLVLSSGDTLTLNSLTPELSNSGAVITGAYAVPRPSGGLQPASIQEARDEWESATILDALRRCAYNRTDTARLLGISRRTLYNKLKRLGMTPGQNRQQ